MEPTEEAIITQLCSVRPLQNLPTDDGNGGIKWVPNPASRLEHAKINLDGLIEYARRAGY